MRHKLFLLALVLVAMAAGVLASGDALSTARSAPITEHDHLAGSGLVVARDDDALIVLSTLELSEFNEVLALVRANGGEVPQAYPPNALVATLTPAVELALRQHPAVARIETGLADASSLTLFGGQAPMAAHIWNTAFRGVPDPVIALAPSGGPAEQQGPDFLIPPRQTPREPGALGAPTNYQTSEFMAGTVVYSVVFVESSGGTGNCSPADPQTENWDAARQTTVLSEIGAGLSFWTGRSNRPNPLTFVLDNRGTQATSCEPITRPGRGLTSDEPKWVADVLVALGRSGATPSNYMDEATAFANGRRTALGADWAYLILVVDSLNDNLNDPSTPGSFSNDAFAYGYLNGPFMVMTYNNDGWGISNMNLVTAHETGHIFGALDEYASSGCSTADSWGYLNVSDASCNNGGITTDRSIMGENWEQQDPSVDVSTSARGAIGWRNPVGAIVDVVRTATASLSPQPPTPDDTPTYSASAGNTPYPPGGLNTVTVDGIPYYRLPSPVSISRVAGAEWNVDGGAFTSVGVTPSDGAFDEEAEEYTFTPPSGLGEGTHTLGTRSVNHFGHKSDIATHILIIDQTPPVTTATLDPAVPNGERGWYISDVTVTLNAIDPDLADGSPGSGVDSTQCRLNGGSWHDCRDPFPVTDEGWNQVDFYSTDVAGNVESTKNVRFKLDKTSPEISITEGILDGLHWDQVHLERGILTNSDTLGLSGNATDNLCLWEVRAVDVDSGQTLASQQPDGANTPDWPPPYPPSSLAYGLSVPLHTGINNIDVVPEDCAG